MTRGRFVTTLRGGPHDGEEVESGFGVVLEFPSKHSRGWHYYVLQGDGVYEFKETTDHRLTDEELMSR